MYVVRLRPSFVGGIDTAFELLSAAQAHADKLIDRDLIQVRIYSIEIGRVHEPYRARSAIAGVQRDEGVLIEVRSSEIAIEAT